MQHIWKVLLTSLLIFALAATACLAEDSEAQYQAYSYTTFSLRRTPSESDRGISVQKKTKILILEWDDAWCKVQGGNKGRVCQTGMAVPRAVAGCAALSPAKSAASHERICRIFAGYADFGWKIQRLHRIRRANRLCGSAG